MPAFVWTGNQSLLGQAAELYRVYVFSDKQCLNQVFVGSVAGSPAYAPRPYGSLTLPRPCRASRWPDSTTSATARSPRDT